MPGRETEVRADKMRQVHGVPEAKKKRMVCTTVRRAERAQGSTIPDADI